jgi:transposase-like protein
MDKKTKFLERKNRKGHFDKRLILEAVKLVEEGTPREEVNRKYQLGGGTLTKWMRDYGSACWHAKKRVTYPVLVKHKIIAEIEQGVSLSEIRKKYKIRSERTLYDWIRKSRNENSLLTDPTRVTMTKSPGKPARESAEIESLQKALDDAHLQVKALNMMIDLAEKDLKIDIRKKSGTKQSGR